jgi:serine/threonine-protein kinase HipA
MSAPLPDRLLVYLDGREAGVLQPVEAGVTFRLRYHDEWRRDPDAYPLSLSLPLAAAEHGGLAVRHYLRGLIPDNQARLHEISARFGVSPDDPYAVLARIGEDCPGAVQFAVPARREVLANPEAGEITWLEHGEIVELVQALHARSDDAAHYLETGRFSLPGALPKLALRWDPEGRRWGLPASRAASTHILKPPLRGVPFHTENEYVCLELARAVGLSTARAERVRFGSLQVLMVERYDRRVEAGEVRRLHQEDLAQALGRDPALKYVGQGAPGVREIVKLLRSHASHRDVDAFVDALVFNWVIVGTDAHVRNYSILIGAGGSVRLAPLYDLASACGFSQESGIPPGARNAPMVIGERRMYGEINRAAWEAEFRAIRYEKRGVSRVRQVVERISSALPEVAGRAEAGGVSRAFLDELSAGIRQRLEVCRRQLDA